MNEIDLIEELDDKTKLLILKMQKELKSKDAEINELKNQLDFLKSQLLNKNRKLFGKSSEQVNENQMSFFNEAEKNSDTRIPEPELEEIVYTRKKPSSYTGKKDNLSTLERVVIEHKLDEAEAICNKCGHPLSIIGSKSKEILKYKPAELYIEEHITYTYACKSCDAEADKANILSAHAPETLLHKGMASNELLAHVITMKYQHALPLYRMETYFEMMDVKLSRQTLSNWIISAASELEHVYDYMRKALLKRNYIHADETPVKVIDNKGCEAKSKHYMWVYVSENIDNSIIMYDYQKTRSSVCPTKFLEGFSGYLQTDGYSGYNKVKDVKRFYCLAHIRRKFHEIIVDLQPETLKQSRAIIGFNYCEQLYKIEKDLREQYINCDNYYDERHKIRLEKSAPILKEFQEYVDVEIENALPKSPLGKALKYAQNLMPSMSIFLTNGCLEIDNNAAERAVKGFVIGRKNWLFSNTSKGAKSSAIIYSIVETAKANGLAVERYLVYLFDKLSECNDMNLLEKYMPWSIELPDSLYSKLKK